LDFSVDDRGNYRACSALAGWSSGARPALDDFYDLIALFGRDIAQLVLEFYAVPAAKTHEVFALHVQLARQFKNTDFVFLQALLLCGHHSWHLLPVGMGAKRRNIPQVCILTGRQFLKRGNTS